MLNTFPFKYPFLTLDYNSPYDKITNMSKSLLVVILLFLVMVSCVTTGPAVPHDLKNARPRVSELIRDGEYQKARETLAPLIEKYEDVLGLKYEFVRTFFMEGRLSGAVPYLEKWLDKHPLDEKFQVMLGNAYMASGELDKAEEALLRAEQSGNVSFPVLNALAELYNTRGKDRGDLQKAAAYYDRAIAAGRVLAEERVEEEKKALYTLIDRCIYSRAELALLFDKDEFQAKNLIAEYLDRNPDDSRAWQIYMHAVVTLGRGEEGVQFIDNAIKNNPEKDFLSILKAQLLLKLKKFEEGLAVIDEKISANPDDVELYKTKGQFYLYLDRIDDARGHLVTMKEKFPDSVETGWFEAIILQADGKNEEALKKAETLLDANPGSVELINLVCGIYAIKKEHDKVKAIIDEHIDKVDSAVQKKRLAMMREMLAQASEPEKERVSIKDINADRFKRLKTEYKRELLKALRGSEERQSVDIFLAAADDESSGVRVQALNALSLLEPKEKFEKAAEKALSDKDEDVRAAAISCLRRWGKKKYLSLVLPFLESESEYIREVAIVAMREIAGEHFGYNPAAKAADNIQALAKWKKHVEGK